MVKYHFGYAFSMLMVGLLMIIAFITALVTPPQTPPPSASELVAIPGLNPVIPLGWGALAFIVALVIHEFGHGLQARAHGMRIRAFGLLQLGPLPLGAFAEPQYEELTNAPSKEKDENVCCRSCDKHLCGHRLSNVLGWISRTVCSR